MKKFIKLFSDFLFLSGLLVAGLFLVGHLTGKNPISAYIVSSGSMEPAIRTGSVVIVAPQSDYTVTDVVTYYSGSDKKITTTHRIVAASEGQFKMMGDSNNQPDPVLVPREKVIGSVRFSIPYLGYLAAQAKTPGGFILLVIVPATIIIYEEIRSLFIELKKLVRRKNDEQMEASQTSRAAGSRQRPGSEHVAVEMLNPRNHFWGKPAIILPIFFALLIPLTISISYFIDRETSSGNSFTGALPTPTPVEDGNTIVPIDGASAPIPAGLTNEQLIGATPTPTPDPTKIGDTVELGSTLPLETNPTPTLSPSEALGEVGPLPTPTPTPDPNQIVPIVIPTDVPNI